MKLHDLRSLLLLFGVHHGVERVRHVEDSEPDQKDSRSEQDSVEGSSFEVNRDTVISLEVFLLPFQGLGDSAVEGCEGCEDCWGPCVNPSRVHLKVVVAHHIVSLESENYVRQHAIS